MGRGAASAGKEGRQAEALALHRLLLQPRTGFTGLHVHSRADQQRWTAACARVPEGGP